jgi:hypothetical protein
LHYVDNLTIAFQDINEFRSLAIPYENMTGIASANHILVLQAEEVDILDGLYIAVALEFPSVWDT